MDYFIIFITTAAGLYFHWWLYKRIRQWSDRDLALSFAGKDEAKRTYMLERLTDAKRQGVAQKALQSWLEQAAKDYPNHP